MIILYPMIIGRNIQILNYLGIPMQQCQITIITINILLSPSVYRHLSLKNYKLILYIF